MLHSRERSAAAAAAAALGITDETLQEAENVLGSGTVDSLFSFGVSCICVLLPLMLPQQHIVLLRLLLEFNLCQFPGFWWLT